MYLNLSLFSKTARLGQILADIDAGGTPKMEFYVGGPPATPDDQPPGALLANLSCSSPFGVISNGFADPELTATGAGYTAIPNFTPAGATGGSGAQFQVVMQVSTFTASGGQNFAVNDLLVLPAISPSCLQPAILTITSVDFNGGITGTSLQQAGQFITTLPSNPVSEFETTGVGYGATVAFATYSVAAVNTLMPGQNYTSAGQTGQSLFTGGAGGAGAAATPRLTPVLVANAITTANAVSGGACGMARIVSAGGLELAITNPGSGGTDGTFVFGVSGGTGAGGCSGTFTVFGGHVVALQLTNPGVYTVAPTITTTASAGLSGAVITAALGAGVVDLDVGVAGSGASVIMNSTTVVTGGPVVATSAYITEA
jgi:hypothetical protein